MNVVVTMFPNTGIRSHHIQQAHSPKHGEVSIQLGCGSQSQIMQQKLTVWVQNWARQTKRYKTHIAVLTTEVKHLEASETSLEYERLLKRSIYK